MTDAVIGTLALMTGAIALEAAVARWRRLRLCTWRDTLTNVAMYAGYWAALLIWVAVVYFIYDEVHEHALFDLGLEGPLAKHWAAAPWVLLIAAEEVCFYTFHRASHRVRLLWTAHQAHHSSRLFNLSTGLRQSWLPCIALPFWLPLPYLGFDPGAVLRVQAASLLVQFFLHTELIRSYGPLDAVLNSPHHHRAHHGRTAQFFDCNFGGWSILLDRLLGTFTPGQPSTYGLDVEPTGALAAELGPWLQLGRDLLRRPTLLAAMRILLGPPGGFESLPTAPLAKEL